MQIKTIKPLILALALAVPVASFAHDGDSDRKHPITFVKDSAITAKVKAKLAAEKIRTLAHVSVDTDADGMVVLSGNVRSEQEAEKAVQIARATDGVTGVTSNLRVVRDK
ncbi:MAG TPA: BON domain-containing protein [Rhodocyclaceae bacterium]|jgi:hyperosmotically inducible protein|nr:BON domain-containing protein [Rhodocyclaceae bacterium]HMV20478.1 BON domain-containing protein [Rhodocyclaceae bacterium]HMW77829.1 BON domain-containing protein [Rhodocyclaceae bacterium]HNE44128.1 BON domain-containing protein [Rhodocyclaceae bacterium]HNM22013.1 BON domain-containing protein [Rhodocyclaceae bacterium]